MNRHIKTLFASGVLTTFGRDGVGEHRPRLFNGLWVVGANPCAGLVQSGDDIDRGRLSHIVGVLLKRET